MKMDSGEILVVEDLVKYYGAGTSSGRWTIHAFR